MNNLIQKAARPLLNEVTQLSHPLRAMDPWAVMMGRNMLDDRKFFHFIFIFSSFESYILTINQDIKPNHKTNQYFYFYYKHITKSIFIFILRNFQTTHNPIHQIINPISFFTKYQ